MQKVTDILPYSRFSIEQFIFLTSIAMEELGWTVQLSDTNDIKGIVKASAWSWGETITVIVYEGEACISSAFNQWQIPIGKKNRRNIDALVQKLTSLQEQWEPEQIQEELNKTRAAEEEYLLDFEERKAQGKLTAEEKVTISWGGCYVTYSLIGIMGVVFLAMCFSGVSIFAPTTADIFKWGGDNRLYTTGGDYWRLITSQFIHIGLFHLFVNCYTLLNIGAYLEPLLGRVRLLAYFLLSGIFGGISSIWWHIDSVSAGASGAIFGLYGIFLALLTTGIFKGKARQDLITYLAIFIGMNLFLGIRAGVDNAGHIGGLLGGIVIGYLYIAETKWKQLHYLFRAVSLGLPLIIFTTYVKATYTKDDAFTKHLVEVVQLEGEATWPIVSGEDKSDNQLAGEVERIVIPKWTQVSTILSDYKTEDLNSFNSRLLIKLKQYAQLRRQEADLYLMKADLPDSFKEEELELIQQQIEKAQEELQSMKP